MNQSAAKAGERFSLKAFGIGLVVVAAVYAGAFGWTAMKAGETMSRIEENLPYLTVSVERPKPKPEAYDYPPASVQASPAPAAEITEAVPQQQTAPVAETPHEASTETKAEAVIEIPTGPLEPAPLDGLFEQTVDGKLPRISEAGLRPFDAYKRPFVSQGKPGVALALLGYGISAHDSDLALALPPEVTLVLSPYSDDPDLWQKKARESGHEVWLWLPMENQNFLAEDPGPQALLTHSSLPDNQKRLNWVMARTTGYAGLVGYTDKVFLDMHAMLGAMMGSVFARGLGYFELNTAGSEFLETLAVGKNSPYANVDKSVSIYAENKFTETEDAARQKGFGVMAIDLTPANIEKIKTWTQTLAGKNMALAPISAVAASGLKAASAMGAAPPAVTITGPAEAHE